MTSTPGTTELDPVIHVPARLRIVAALGALPDREAITFTRLQEILDLTGGNLITHLRKLEEAGYVQTVRTGGGRSSQTRASLTPSGRLALAAYRRALARILDQAAPR
ncbi:MAG: transcriptional regulator [Pedococcus sp.]